MLKQRFEETNTYVKGVIGYSHSEKLFKRYEYREMQDKCNGLHYGTKFYEYQENRHIVEFHEHPQTGELVVMHCWWLLNGEDDVMPEFEVVGVYTSLVCEIVKKTTPYMINGKMPLAK